MTKQEELKTTHAVPNHKIKQALDEMVHTLYQKITRHASIEQNQLERERVAESYLSEGEVEKAMTLYIRNIQEETRLYSSYHKLAQIYHDLDDPKGEADVLDKGIRMLENDIYNPEDEAIHQMIELSQLLEKAAYITEALQKENRDQHEHHLARFVERIEKARKRLEKK